MVYAWGNLEVAYRKARKGKRARKQVAAFEFDRESNLTGLYDELRCKTYQLDTAQASVPGAAQVVELCWRKTMTFNSHTLYQPFHNPAGCHLQECQTLKPPSRGRPMPSSFAGGKR